MLLTKNNGLSVFKDGKVLIRNSPACPCNYFLAMQRAIQLQRLKHECQPNPRSAVKVTAIHQSKHIQQLFDVLQPLILLLMTYSRAFRVNCGIICNSYRSKLSRQVDMNDRWTQKPLMQLCMTTAKAILIVPNKYDEIPAYA